MTTQNNPPLGQELRARRQSRGLHQMEVAPTLETTTTVVAAWEDGDQVPSDEHAAALVELFSESEQS
ncbi:helix-turn-helix transcriptional regulator [Halococcus sp. PRR34]|uniref:helix-turn-helix domain-containing protein n=1 Tax=Halococcus sp. PRR34 TaxID=3020830 RepID=UPI00236141FB|nr:helix-turn-helix transcriptional regulator [Halococcus sp. PRR34]